VEQVKQQLVRKQVSDPIVRMNQPETGVQTKCCMEKSSMADFLIAIP